MDVSLSLMDGGQREEAVRRIADHQETMFWPAVLSSCLEDLLLAQVVVTVDEIFDLLANHGACWNDIFGSFETMVSVGGDDQPFQSDDYLVTKSQFLEPVVDG